LFQCGSGFSILGETLIITYVFKCFSQAGPTRDYLKCLQQGNLKLPEGPLFLNPESALRAFKKEVIDRTPEIFKISCLTNLRNLFLRRDPYFAGYGNRTNDVTAYEAVGIPRPRIFIINKTGELRGIVAETFQTSYRAQSDLVDVYFPPSRLLDTELDASYWSPPHLPLEGLPL
jgi:phosphatidate phosphatase LPIN